MRIINYQRSLGGLGGPASTQDLWNEWHKSYPTGTFTAWKAEMATKYPTMDTSSVRENPRWWWKWAAGGALVGAAYLMSR